MNEYIVKEEYHIGSVTMSTRPLIHCQDCRYFDISKNGENGICKEHQRPMFAWDYCSYGERKDG